jgi:hypothetical protein
VKRVKIGGGQVVEGPIEVPGGSWIIQCLDPQGALFALVGKRRYKAIVRLKPVAPRDPSNFRLGLPKRARGICSTRAMVSPVRRRDRLQIDQPAPRRGIRSGSSSRTDRY